MTCKLLTGTRGKELLISYLAGFPARTYPAPAKGQESTANSLDSGKKWPASLAKYDQATHSLRMPQTCLFADLTESCVILPRWGLMRYGEIWPRPQLERRMSASGHGYLLPTLTVNGNNNRAGLSKKSGNGLQTILKLLPTLCATDWKGPYSKEGYDKQMQTRSKPLRDTLPHEVGFRLSPGFAEWFMGWPLGWTMLPDCSHEKHKTARIKALGNGQVPLCAAMAFLILREELL
jgi:hypothetical protein